MSFFTGIWNSFLDVIGSALTALHGVLEPLFGVHAWGWAIIGLTLIVRTLLLPLAIKQTRSMRGMQAIQPRVKEIQKKYKVDRDLLEKDPETYQRRKAEMNEKLMELYKEEGVNPASSCLPLLLQMPIFFALFRVLGVGGLDDLREAQFYFFTSFISQGEDVAQGLGATISQAGWPGWMLIAAMAGTMFLTQRQMMSRNAAEGPAATQQKVMMYVFPVFLAVISFNFPLAVVLYWVTTNIWQGVQQYAMFRTVAHDAPDRPGGESAGKAATPGSGGGGTPPAKKKAPEKGSSTTTKKNASGKGSTSTPASKNGSGSNGSGKKGSGSKKDAGHLPKRRS